MSGFPKSVLGLGLSNIFINDLKEDIDCTLSRFADSNKLGRVAEGRARIQNHLNNLDKWYKISQMKFNNKKFSPAFSTD